MKRICLVLPVLLVIAALCSGPVLATAEPDAAVAYLETQQNTDGGFGSGFSPDSSVNSTSDAVLAIVAAGKNPADLDQGGNTPLSYLVENAAQATMVGDQAKVVLAAIAAGENPRSLGGVDLVSSIEENIGEDGRIGGEADTFFGHCLAVVALCSAGRPIPETAVEYIKASQQEDGSWSWDGTDATVGDTNSTAMAVEALVAAGEAADGTAITQALAYYRSIQNEDGGWPYQVPSDYGTETDTNSTAVVVQALVAAGENPSGDQWASSGSITPMTALKALQNESGAFAWKASVPDDNLLATVQALPALVGKAFPFAMLDAGDTGQAQPSALPDTGGAGLPIAAALVFGGLVLFGGGYVLRSRR